MAQKPLRLLFWCGIALAVLGAAQTMHLGLMRSDARPARAWARYASRASVASARKQQAYSLRCLATPG
jgi:hypothetical protein